MQVDPELPLIYILPSRSSSDLMLLDRTCRRTDLPSPADAISLGSTKLDHRFFFHLKNASKGDQEVASRISRTLPNLINLVKDHPGEDVQLIPVSIIWGRAPQPASSWLELLFPVNWTPVGRFKKMLALMIHGRNTEIHYGHAVRLSEVIASDEDKPSDTAQDFKKVSRLLRIHFHQHKTSVVGPDLSHRRTIIDTVMKDELVQKAISEAIAEGMSKEEAKKKVRAYVDEIASDVSPNTIRFLDRLLKWFWTKFYNGAKVSNVEPVKHAAQDHEILYLPCHRSHIDYLLLSYVLYDQGLSTPHIAAGINLNMPIVGRILRGGGAFFIRRTFKGNNLYTAVFNGYLHVLLTQGFPTEFFIEGGRSRTGRSLQPKTGMLAMIVRSYLRNSDKPIALVPVYIGYERSIEISSYLTELRGKKKRKESVFDIFKTFGKLKGNFGQVSVNFGKIQFLSDELEAYRPGWRAEQFDQEFKPGWLPDFTDKLANNLVTEINAAAHVNPINLLSTIILSTPRQSISHEDLTKSLSVFQNILQKTPYSSTMTVSDLEPQAIIDYGMDMRLLEMNEDLLGTVYTVDPTSAVIMTYFRNNTLHLFALPSLIAGLFIQNDRFEEEDIKTTAKLIYPYLKRELFIKWSDNDIDRVIEHWLNLFLEQGYLVSLTNRKTNNVLAAPNHGSDAYAQLTTLSQLIGQTVERILIVAAILKRNQENPLSRSALEEQSIALARRLSLLHGLNSPEYSDKNLFKSFIDQLIQSEVISVDDQDENLIVSEDFGNTMEQLTCILTADVRKSILQVTHTIPNKDKTEPKQ